MAAMLHPTRSELDYLQTFSQIGAQMGMSAEALAGLMAVLEVTDADNPVHIAMLALKDFEQELKDWT